MPVCYSEQSYAGHLLWFYPTYRIPVSVLVVVHVVLLHKYSHNNTKSGRMRFTFDSDDHVILLCHDVRHRHSQ